MGEPAGAAVSKSSAYKMRSSPGGASGGAAVGKCFKHGNKLLLCCLPGVGPQPLTMSHARLDTPAAAMRRNSHQQSQSKAMRMHAHVCIHACCKQTQV